MSQLFTLRMTNAALAQTSFPANDYKALVCVFLFGGNDSGNTLIPYDGGNQNYSDYASSRGGLAVPQNSLSNTLIQPIGMSRRFAFHPSLNDVSQLFNQGNVSVVSNVGTLVEPTTKTQFQNKSAELPPQLFAHNTQQELWQISTADAVGRIGWGGRIADALQAAGAQNTSGVSMNISLDGSNFFLVGNQVTPYAVSPNGAIEFNPNGVVNSNAERQTLSTAYADLMAMQGNPDYSGRHELGKAFSDVAERSLYNGAIITDIENQNSAITTPVPSGNKLADQLAAVARLIEFAPTKLGQNRQVYFVALGGFDHHKGLIGPHDDLLGQVNDGLKFFWDALGQINRRNDVTTFTSSDFGRTYVSNGQGSDHGWGGHHMVMGGDQLNGGEMFGEYNNISVDGPDDTSEGRFIPTTSVDEYAFEFAKWMGVPLSEMPTLFPNLGRFLTINNPSTHLGLLN